jgi:AAA domain
VNAAHVLERLEYVRRNGASGWTARCPAHNDHRPSLSIAIGDDDRILLTCHAGCSTAEVLAQLGLDWYELFARNGAGPADTRPEATYDYVNAAGELLFQVVRFPGKQFRQRRPDDGGGWIWKLGDVERVLYRLPRVLEAIAQEQTVYVVEGEKDVHAAERASAVATTNPGGAGKWRESYSAQLRDAAIVVVADTDEPGLRHAREVVGSLQGEARSVELVAPLESKDLSDHLAAGHTLAELRPLELEDSPGLDGASLSVVPLERFAATEEDSAEPLLGSAGDMPLAAGGTLLLYGDGGTSKTTLTIDAALHLAAGADWLGLEVARPLRVLLIENEGPRGPFRAKLARKRESWSGPEFGGRVFVLEEPWGAFTFAIETHRAQLAAYVDEHEFDLVVCGPLAALGAVGGGTPDEVSAFEALLADLRARCQRPLAFWLAHHENKQGDVAGAWERFPDTLAHARLEGRERTRLHWRKVRWSSRLHDERWTLRWVLEREGFEVVDEEASAAAKAAALEDARAWVVEAVTHEPGRARSTLEKAFAEAHGKGGRALARRAIDAELNGEHSRLAKGPGRAANGVYLYPAPEASSPLAEPLFGKPGEQGSNPESGTVLANSPLPCKGEANGGEHTDGVADQGSEIEWR